MITFWMGQVEGSEGWGTLVLLTLKRKAAGAAAGGSSAGGLGGGFGRHVSAELKKRHRP